MIVIFVRGLSKKVRKLKQLRATEINVDYIIRENQEQERLNQQRIHGSHNSTISTSTSRHYESLAEEDISVVEHSHKEASNIYEFYKLLAQENYDLGKNTSEFIREFRSNNKDLSQAITMVPQQMQSLNKFIEELINIFHCSFNFGKSVTERKLQYCRPAVEHYIFGKVCHILYEIYDKKHEEENQKFLKNQSLIRSKRSPFEIMESQGVPRHFQGEESTQWRWIPYKSTIDCLNKVEYELTPSAKFETLMKASLELRNCILDITSGKVRISLIYREN
jgi:hypothetical protein